MLQRRILSTHCESPCCFHNAHSVTGNPVGPPQTCFVMGACSHPTFCPPKQCYEPAMNGLTSDAAVFGTTERGNRKRLGLLANRLRHRFGNVIKTVTSHGGVYNAFIPRPYLFLMTHNHRRPPSIVPPASFTSGNPTDKYPPSSGPALLEVNRRE